MRIGEKWSDRAVRSLRVAWLATAGALAPGAGGVGAQEPAAGEDETPPTAGLEGRILDAVTGHPVEDAYVGADSGWIAVLTDGRGDFTLELRLDLRHRVVVSALGYREDTLAVEAEAGRFPRMEIALEPSPVTLGQFESIPPAGIALVEIFGGLMSVDQIRAYTPQFLAKRSLEEGWPVPLGMSAGLCPGHGEDEDARSPP